MWHPLRPPTYHAPEAVQFLYGQLSEGWRQILAIHPETAEDDWYRVEIEKTLKLFQHAAASNECVVSVLEAPSDPERGDRVCIPFVKPFIQ
jgi:hypothetical protein